ncbi:hypothetical protein AB0D49_19790 [Streptomyces sp. NPDC048290]|uniref:hypothetical protein n=1 Tax=Streptomyces sp. NPDC048290 TaxID=3155811 RepID=UPI003430B869
MSAMAASGRVVLRELAHQVGGSFGEAADAMYARLTDGPPGGIGWGPADTVAATPDEHRAWRLATRRFQETVVAAERRRAAAQFSLRNRFLPGGARRRALASAHCRAVLGNAVRMYRPVITEIERRRAAEQAERRRRQQELNRRWRERAERDQERRREQSRRHLSVAAQAVWGWTLTERGGTREVWVFRYDVGPGRRSVEVVDRSAEPLTAVGLERRLKALARESRPGRLRCRWDERATMRVARECTVGELVGDFEIWWAAVTHSYWESPYEVPERRRERSGSGGDPGGGDPDPVIPDPVIPGSMGPGPGAGVSPQPGG